MKLPTNDVFEKEELVERLYQARLQTEETTATESSNPTATAASQATSSADSSSAIQVPLYIASTDQTIQVAAVNLPNGGGLTLRPNEQQFATIKINVLHNNANFPLTLLLDTACSGVVLRPEIVSRNNLPSLSTPVTMTGAGGAAAATGLTQLSFCLEESDKQFGPLPAAVQDIGGLPPVLDGIVGLSFLQQFAAIDLDFSQGRLVLHTKAPPTPTQKIVAQAPMTLLGSLGVYTVPVWLGTRGPVSLLVDSGAACTLLSWKGVGDLGLERGSAALTRLDSMGAMGSDNMAIALTHRLHVSSRLSLGSSLSSSSDEGLDLSGADRRLAIDVGEIPLLDQLASQGVGGILGVDALARCATVRLVFGGRPEVLLLQ